jgi:hypothetical protein
MGYGFRCHPTLIARVGEYQHSLGTWKRNWNCEPTDAIALGLGGRVPEAPYQALVRLNSPMCHLCQDQLVGLYTREQK